MKLLRGGWRRVFWAMVLGGVTLGILEVVRAQGPAGRILPAEPDYIRRPNDRLQPAMQASRPRLATQPLPGQGRATIDVMVLYSREAEAAHGHVWVQQTIAAALATLNEACNRSGVQARFRLVYSAQTAWHTEYSDIQTELRWLSSDSRVANLRAKAGADLVSLLVQGHAQGATGFGELPGAFSVFEGNPLTFAHEIGHNLGLEHDRPHSEAGDSQNWNFGYTFVAPGTKDLYGTIMSYAGSQIEQFSSSERCFLGAPTGLERGHVNSQGQPDAADAVDWLNLVAGQAALESDCASPLLAEPSMSQDGAQFQFTVQGPTNQTCTIEWTGDFRSWTAQTETELVSARQRFIDEPGDARARFYRAAIGGDAVPVQVGFVRKTVLPGYSMIANPLENSDNTVAVLLNGMPEGTRLYKWFEGQQRWECNLFSWGCWDNPAMTLHPGEGAVIWNPSAIPLELRFVGEVNSALHSRVPLQLSLRGVGVPESGGLCTELECAPYGPGTLVFRMTRSDGAYSVYSWDGACWSPSEPHLELGEAFWCQNSMNAFIWQHGLGARP